MKNAKHILVTGGAGFIGSHLVERLLNDGKALSSLTIFDRQPDNLRAVKKNPRLKIIRQNFRVQGIAETRGAFGIHFSSRGDRRRGAGRQIGAARFGIEFSRDANFAARRRETFHAAAADFHLGSLWQERQAGVRRG
jgi:nucleoside-diphosphate-sugar epimerase